MKPKIGDYIVTNSNANMLTDGMVISIWGNGPILPKWAWTKWFTKMDRDIVGWFCSKMGRVGCVIKSTSTITKVDTATNTIWLS